MMSFLQALPWTPSSSRFLFVFLVLLDSLEVVYGFELALSSTSCPFLA